MTNIPKPPPANVPHPGVEKKKFVPHPHLRSSPLRDNEALAALRDELHNKARSN